MKRIEKVYEKLKELYSGTGISAVEVADLLGLSRANTSSDLNKLCEEGIVTKSSGRPVLFSPLLDVEAAKGGTSLDVFAEENISLFSAVEQAKAAILYPPKGMNILILGETGVGKSMFAGIIHEYAIEMKKMDKASPFITFNCADYANNPQLLLSQLFGAKKGSYTGADSDRIGLIEKADGGILFLDEVHRLPSEGQEMFFTFMDKGNFRRLGETEAERKAKVLIISATTENPDSTLLRTFTRRIPMIIRIPSLSERSMEERFHLIQQFLMEESARLNREIMLSVNSMRALLSYNCSNNVGQLKTDIQLICAKAYADFVSNRKEYIRIGSNELPRYIREGLYKETEHRQIWNKLIGINKRYCIFNKGEKNIIFRDEREDKNIYDMIEMHALELKGKGMSVEEIETEMGKDIDDYFAKYINSVNGNSDTSNLENVIDPQIIKIVEEIVRFSEEKLKRSFSSQIYHGMALHISSSIERIRHNKKIINPRLNKIRQEYAEEFSVAMECIKMIDSIMDISMPIDEAAFLALFLIYDEKNTMIHEEKVRIIVIAHGNSTATSLADVANKLIGTKYAVGINAPLEERPEQVLCRLKEYIRECAINSDILFLVDMGSLTTFGQEIEKEMNIKTKTIPLVSSLHVIEASRKAILGYTLEDVYRDTLQVNAFLENEIVREKSKTERAPGFAIITICTTGEGSAQVIKKFMEGQLKFDNNLLAIIALDLTEKNTIYTKLRNISKEKRILCIVSPFKLDIDIPQYGLEEVLSLRALKVIQNIIDFETTYIKMGDTLKEHLTNVDGEDVFMSIRKFMSDVEEQLKEKIDPSVLIGASLHIGCMIDRIIGGLPIVEFEEKKEYMWRNSELYTIVKRACEPIKEKYNIDVSDDDICFIMRFFND